MRGENQIGDMFIFPRENLNIHWRPGKSVNEASSIRGATWLNIVLYFIYRELIFQSKCLIWAYKKLPWGEEEKTKGTPTLSKTSNWSVSDFIRNVLGKLCQGSAQIWVTALKARLKIAQTTCVLSMTSWVALPQDFLLEKMKIGRLERKPWLQNFCFFYRFFFFFSVFVNKTGQGFLSFPKNKWCGPSAHSSPPRRRELCSNSILVITFAPFHLSLPGIS